MENRSMLIGLHGITGVGWKTIKRVIDSCSDLRELREWSFADYTRTGIPAAKAECIIEGLDEGKLQERVELARRLGIGFLTRFDSDYPDLLAETAQPPWVLYYRGSLKALEYPKIGIVGTRTPTAYGKKIAEELAAALSGSGITVVSGLARGIDAQAHRGAIGKTGGTIAVLGVSPDRIYPPEHGRLQDEIIGSGGLLLSEYPVGTLPHPGLFPLRNRIIAGLSLGIVVVEAAERSGSLITADLALEESRDVFAVPGPIHSPKSRGALYLIKQGAKMVISPEDILEEYTHLSPSSGHFVEPLTKSATQSPEEGMSADEVVLYRFLSSVPVTADVLLEQTQFTFGHLHSVLLSLLLKNKIAEQPGSTYVSI
ncbi:DNA-processing protein DprA [Paenibacillus lutrae]|uniref:DNA-protecting protein DprA n=1 Tax=Paenibacillus lutrae TaxID=2078573 RepID=A0A7X3FGC8_9BACL|nr:DNA-processing protein DprA [Paenibacillus lutrae]MVO99171.1 DNA-protecting protein DprA [Paenibacillus lutrae]